MAEGDEFRIKGAASRSSVSEQSPSGSQDQTGPATENPSEQAEQAEQAQGKNGPAEGGETKKSQDGVDPMADLRAKYKWFKCKAEGAQYPEGSYYYIHYDTQQTTWDEPAEPYWMWDPVVQGPDTRIGLMKNGKSVETHGLADSKQKDEEYQGYNPKIHGNYDPNADYAKFHEKKRLEERELDEQKAFMTAAQQPDYGATMALNRFTGRAQVGDFGPERYSDAAKSGRQMNAFFDVDAAANQHGGKSLKAERRQTRVSKEDAKRYNQERKEKKEKKRRGWLQN
ncbi:hypothetical protein AC578_1638 [Pseudocercospora eumusae]|uniref:WW domain-containing protein n=1 Tax=Pseudocercospora eumusae TaxID=321146 RepID=A0A139HLV6_9PEZI|nr:hypothetical protein AC578_1638 [Pseudocercospora eumusae]